MYIYILYIYIHTYAYYTKETIKLQWSNFDIKIINL